MRIFPNPLAQQIFDWRNQIVFFSLIQLYIREKPCSRIEIRLIFSCDRLSHEFWVNAWFCSCFICSVKMASKWNRFDRAVRSAVTPTRWCKATIHETLMIIMTNDGKYIWYTFAHMELCFEWRRTCRRTQDNFRHSFEGTLINLVLVVTENN